MFYRNLIVGCAWAACFAVPSADAATNLYVVKNNPGAAAPYNAWSNAAANIQTAVDYASPDDTVVVSNGVYDTGSRIMPEWSVLASRLVITNSIVVKSMNGPAATVIKGVGPSGTNAVRCVYLGSGTLDGFTLTNGCTRTGGDYYYDQSGGGAFISGGTLTNCLLTGNASTDVGGGAYGGVLYNCTLAGNSSSDGGGAYQGTLYNCTLTGNRAASGGGAGGGTLYNCLLSGNTASAAGGGAYYGTLYNCTLTGNSATNSGGGAYGSALYNCILYYNSAGTGSNYLAGILGHCCTTPLPVGTGNTDKDPGLVSLGHIAVSSPCIAAGSAAYTNGVDIDGNPWKGPPAIGCDEPTAGTLTGTLAVAVFPQAVTASTHTVVGFTAQVTGRCTSNVWTFGDGGKVTNAIYTGHAWSVPGDYPVVLRAFNESIAQGVAVTVTIHVGVASFYVARGNPNAAAPYNSWNIAAADIQTAVDFAAAGDTVLVSNGVYDVGARVTPGYSLSNRVVITRNIMVRSVNGPEETVIKGAGPQESNSVRCVFITSGRLAGFTLTNGFALTGGDAVYDRSGGGVFAASGTLYNCTLTGNAAADGGGAYSGALYNCLLTGNTATNNGGGAHGGRLYSCTLSGNEAGSAGGGSYESALAGCILYYNTAPAGTNYNGGGLTNCCADPLPAGPGNIDTAPAFVNTGSGYGTNYAAGNCRLKSDSPCINAGTNLPWMTDPADLRSRDLAGDPRIASEVVDMGAYENQQPLEGYGLWLALHGLPTDGSADELDGDTDGMDNRGEWLSDTDPTNHESVLEITLLRPATNGTYVNWRGGTSVWQYLECRTNLVATNEPWAIIYTNPPPTGVATGILDAAAPGTGRFYRLRAVHD